MLKQTMQLATERIFVKENDAMHHLCHIHALLYNQALFRIRQEYFKRDDLNLFGKQDNIYGELDIESGIIDTSKAEKKQPITRTYDKKRLGFKKKDDKISENMKKEKKEFHEIPGKLSYFDLDDKAMIRYLWYCPECEIKNKIKSDDFEGWMKCSGHSKEVVKSGTCPYCGSSIINLYHNGKASYSAETIKRCTVAWESIKRSIGVYNACKHPSHYKTKLKGKIHRTCPGCRYSGLPKYPDYLRGDDCLTAIKMPYNTFTIKDHFIHFIDDVFEPVYIKIIENQRYVNKNQKTGIPAHYEPENINPIIEVRVVPAYNGYWVECIQNKMIMPADVTIENAIGIDLGGVFLATIVDNRGGDVISYSGDVVKKINDWYTREITRITQERDRCNPRHAILQRKMQLHRDDASNPSLTYEEWNEFRGLSRYTTQMQKITETRNNRLGTHFHKLSRLIIDETINRRVGIIFIGHNLNQKQNINIKRQNNRRFSQNPIFDLIDTLTYKAALRGIKIIQVPEAYTSKASSRDNDPIPDWIDDFKGKRILSFSGKRSPRGVYTCKDGIKMHSDVNAAYNIMRKGIEMFRSTVETDGIEEGSGKTIPEAPEVSLIRLYPRTLDISAS